MSMAATSASSPRILLATSSPQCRLMARRSSFASDRSGNDDIWIMNSDGSDQQNLTNHPAAEAWPFFSGDGNVIYFQSDRLGVQSNIMMMELDGSNQSYYSFEFMTNAALLPDAITTRLATDLPTITEVLTSTVAGIVPGVEGDLTEVCPLVWPVDSVAASWVGVRGDRR